MRYHISPLGGLAVLLLFLGGLLGETSAEVNSARGQTLYVPVYAEIPYGDRDHLPPLWGRGRYYRCCPKRSQWKTSSGRFFVRRRGASGSVG